MAAAGMPLVCLLGKIRMTCPRLMARAQRGRRACLLIPQSFSVWPCPRGDRDRPGPVPRKTWKTDSSGGICGLHGQVSVSSSHNRTRSAPSEEVDPKLHLVHFQVQVRDVWGKDVLSATQGSTWSSDMQGRSAPGACWEVGEGASQGSLSSGLMRGLSVQGFQ